MIRITLIVQHVYACGTSKIFSSINAYNIDQRGVYSFTMYRFRPQLSTLKAPRVMAYPTLFIKESVTENFFYKHHSRHRPWQQQRNLNQDTNAAGVWDPFPGN